MPSHFLADFPSRLQRMLSTLLRPDAQLLWPTGMDLRKTEVTLEK